MGRFGIGYLSRAKPRSGRVIIWAVLILSALLYMSTVETTQPTAQNWETVSDGVSRTLLRAQPGEKRVLIKIEAGRTYPHHAHNTPDEVFVVEGTYCDPGVENGRAFPAGSYLYYPPGTEHRASSPSGSEGCTILVWNSGK